MTFDIMCRLFIIMIPPAILRVLKAGSSMEEIIGLPDDLPPGQYRVNIYGLTAEFTLE